MTQLEDDIRDLRGKVERNISTIKKASVESAKEGFLGELNAYQGEFKKSSEEFKYVSKLLKAFNDAEYDEIKEFIESNYDRYEHMSDIIKTFDENFSTKEANKYLHRYDVLNKCMLIIIEKGI